MPHSPSKLVYKLSYGDIKNSIEKAHPDMSPHDVRIEAASLLRPRFAQDMRSNRIESSGDLKVYGEQDVIIKGGDIFYPNYGKDGISSEELNERTLRIMPENYTISDHQASRLAAKTLDSGARQVVVDYVREGSDNRDIQIFEIDPLTGRGKTLTINTSTDGKLHTVEQMRAIIKEKFPELREVQLSDGINMFTDKPLPQKEMQQIVNKVQIDVQEMRGSELVKKDNKHSETAKIEEISQKRIFSESRGKINENRYDLPQRPDAYVQDKHLVVQKDKLITEKPFKQNHGGEVILRPTTKERIKTVLSGLIGEPTRSAAQVYPADKAKRTNPNFKRFVEPEISVPENRNYKKLKRLSSATNVVGDFLREQDQSQSLGELIKRPKKDTVQVRPDLTVLEREVNLGKKKEGSIKAGIKHEMSLVNSGQKEVARKPEINPVLGRERKKIKNRLTKEKLKKIFSERRRKKTEKSFPGLGKRKRVNLGENVIEGRSRRHFVLVRKEVKSKFFNALEKRKPEKIAIKHRVRQERQINYSFGRRNVLNKEIVIKIREHKTISGKEKRIIMRKTAKNFTIAWILWLVTKTEVLPVSADLKTKDNGLNYGELIPPGSRPFLLLSIIWYLAQLREQGWGSKPVKKFTNKKIKKKVILTSRLSFPPRGIIFSSFS